MENLKSQGYHVEFSYIYIFMISIYENIIEQNKKELN